MSYEEDHVEDIHGDDQGHGELKRTVTITISEYENVIKVESGGDPADEEGLPLDQVSVAAKVGYNAGQAALHSLNHGPDMVREALGTIPQIANVAPLLRHAAAQGQDDPDTPPKGH